jgi:hypothetical protein
MQGWILPATALIGGGGLAYYFLSLRDTTPVGLTIVKMIQNETLGVDSNGTKYTVQFVEGTFRNSDKTLPVSSMSNKEPLLVVFKDDEPIDARVIKLSNWKAPDARDYEDNQEGKAKLDSDYNKILNNFISLGEEYDIDMENLKSELRTTESSSAEMNFRASNTLQSHFVW